MSTIHDWPSQIRALHAVHQFGLSTEIGALEKAIAWLTGKADTQATLVVYEWYAAHFGETS